MNGRAHLSKYAQAVRNLRERPPLKYPLGQFIEDYPLPVQWREELHDYTNPRATAKVLGPGRRPFGRADIWQAR